MGIEYYTARFLLEARKNGVSFWSCLTIGRQNFFVSDWRLRELGKKYSFDSEQVRKEITECRGYIEPFLRIALGAEEITSIDASAYENATVVHDLNNPIPSNLENKFDAVIEAGSLEHIFNFPVAIRNLMQAVKLNGSLLIQTPANNYFGHGFYQFSPELFYRVLSDENGYKVEKMVVFEHLFPGIFPETKIYAVSDPASVKRRVQLNTSGPVLMLISARRKTITPPFASPPMQSDYVAVWSEKNEPSKTGMSGIREAALRMVENLPLPLLKIIDPARKHLMKFGPTFANNSAYQKEP